MAIRNSDGNEIKNKIKTKTPVPRKVWYGIGGGVLLIAAVIGIAALFGGKQLIGIGEGTEEQLLSKFVSATYQLDPQGIWGLWPQKFRDRAVEEIGELYNFDTEEETLDKLDDTLVSYNVTLNNLYGESWTYAPKVTDEYVYTEEDLEDINIQYAMMGIPDFTVSEAKLYTVQVELNGANGVTGSQVLYVPLIKSGGGWYLGQQIGTAYLDYYDPMELNPFGNLLDGFAIKVLDVEGAETAADGTPETLPDETVPQELIKEHESMAVSGNDVSGNDAVEVESIAEEMGSETVSEEAESAVETISETESIPEMESE